MRISCLPVSLFASFDRNECSIASWAAEAKMMGLDGIDISMMNLKNHTYVYLKEMKQVLKETDIRIVMATTYPDFTHPSHVQRERELDYLKRDIALCDELGVEYLRVLAGQSHPGIERKEGVENAVHYLRLAQEFSQKYSTRLLYENHAKPMAWDYVDFSYPMDIFMDIFKGIRESGIRLNYDIGNAVSLGLDPIGVYEQLKDHVATIHLSDMKEKGQFSPVAIGTGAVPIPQFLDRLRQDKFDGWLCIEESCGNGMEGIRTAVGYVKKCLDSGVLAF